MRIVLFVLPGLFLTGRGHCPNLSEVALTTAFANESTDYNQMWKDSQGDELTRFAVATSDRDIIQAALLLGGTVIAKGVQLPVLTNGLAVLCQMILSQSARDEFFADSVVAEKKKTLRNLKEPREFGHDYDAMLIARLFPLAHLHYVCGTDIPLFAKIAILKERVPLSLFFEYSNMGDYKLLVPPLSSSLEETLTLLRQTEQGDLGYLLEVEYEGGYNIGRGESPVSYWLTSVFEKLFPSEYFRANRNGEYRLIIRPEISFAHNYAFIGKLLGLSVLNSVPIGVSLDKKLLQALLSVVPYNSHGLPVEIQRLQEGFYEVIPRTALLGRGRNRRTLLTTEELNDVLRGNYKHF